MFGIRRVLLPAALALTGSAASAQTTPVERVEKARTEVNTVENAADRAVYACSRNQQPKCANEARTAANAASRALYALDKALEALKAGHGGHTIDPPPFVPLTVGDIEPIASIADIAPLVEKAPIPKSMAPDVVGAFRFICNVSGLSYDDPIAYPRQPGKAHLHMFFGNTGTNAHSDYASLRTSGEGTCQGGALNRSAYWIPALLNGAGQVVVPNYVATYYKRRPSSDPECGRPNPDFTDGTCAGIPVGLRAIFGTNYVTGHEQSPHVRFDCNTEASFTASLTETVAKCRGASEIYARIETPDCWDGENLDSQDHQSHLAYGYWDGRTGKLTCPATHKVVIPQLTLTVAYAVLPGDTPETWIFSSDVQAGKSAGSTFHADYMEAWEPEARLAWERNCLDGFLSCAAGDLGDGRGMKWPAGFTLAQRPHLVAVPERP